MNVAYKEVDRVRQEILDVCHSSRVRLSFYGPMPHSRRFFWLPELHETADPFRLARLFSPFPTLYVALRSTFDRQLAFLAMGTAD